MHRALTVAAVVALATAACSSAGDEAGGPVSPTDGDAVATFCTDWDRFDDLTNADGAPTEALVQEVVDLQNEMGTALPPGLDAEWASILGWNTTFIEYLQTAGYQEMSEEMFFDLLGGEEAALLAAEEREGAYRAIRAWARTNCPASSDASFCDLWPPYADLLDADPEPTEELVNGLLEMQDQIDDVLPAELGTAWAGIVDWNQAFIDVFERLGYGPVTEEIFLEAFDGDEAAARAAEEAQETGLAAVRQWADSNCADESERASSFCEHWEEFAYLTADEGAMTPQSYGEAIAVIERVGDEVPAEVRDEWTAVVESTRGFHDVLVSVNFEPDRITDELLEQAFGSVEAAVAIEEAGDAGLAAIEQWSLAGCGDFCTRWPDLRRALDETGSPDLGWVRDSGEDEGPARLAEHLRLLEIGDRLVPDELREPWALAVAARRDWVEWWESLDFEREQTQIFDRPDTAVAAQDRAIALMRNAAYLVDTRHSDLNLDDVFVRVLKAWQDGADEAPEWLSSQLDPEQEEIAAAWLDGSGGPPDWLIGYWQMGPDERVGGQLTAALDGWVDEHCEAVTGRPGTVKVRFPRVEGAAGDTLVLALTDRGATIEDLADPSRVLAGACSEIASDPWGVQRDENGGEQGWESEEFGSDRWEGSLCDYRWEEGPALVDAGTYTMLAAVIEGGQFYASDVTPTVSACLAFDVDVGGDTVVDVPTLPPCDVDLGGSDDPWRHPPPVDPSTLGAGTLQIVFPDLVGDGEGGEVLVVVLPTGTTLNDVGREQVWPAGATRTWPLDPGFATQHGTSAVTVPVAALPATGAPSALEPHWLAEGQPAERLPLAVLAPGTYDVHVQIAMPDPPEQEDSDRAKNDRCGTFEVTIAGDTIVDLPELGECPTVT